LELYRDCCGYNVVSALGEYFLGSTLGITFVGPCPHRDRECNFWKFYLIRTGFFGESV
jgi:hypothetical protein